LSTFHEHNRPQRTRSFHRSPVRRGGGEGGPRRGGPRPVGRGQQPDPAPPDAARALPGDFLRLGAGRSRALGPPRRGGPGGCDNVSCAGPALMQAANEGVKRADPEGKQASVGIRVELPFEQDVNAFVSQAYEHRTFFTRLHHFVLVSDAYVVCPGGIGTVLETLMVWQLLQVRHLHGTPLILAGHFWDGLIGWARDVMLQPDFALVSPADLEIPRILTDAPSIVQAIREHHAAWQRQGLQS